jgi:hypothetical protein
MVRIYSDFISKLDIFIESWVLSVIAIVDSE